LWRSHEHRPTNQCQAGISQAANADSLPQPGAAKETGDAGRSGDGIRDTQDGSRWPADPSIVGTYATGASVPSGTNGREGGPRSYVLFSIHRTLHAGIAGDGRPIRLYAAWKIESCDVWKARGCQTEMVGVDRTQGGF